MVKGFKVFSAYKATKLNELTDNFLKEVDSRKFLDFKISYVKEHGKVVEYVGTLYYKYDAEDEYKHEEKMKKAKQEEEDYLNKVVYSKDLEMYVTRKVRDEINRDIKTDRVINGTPLEESRKRFKEKYLKDYQRSKRVEEIMNTPK